MYYVKINLPANQYELELGLSQQLQPGRQLFCIFGTSLVVASNTTYDVTKTHRKSDKHKDKTKILPESKEFVRN